MCFIRSSFSRRQQQKYNTYIYVFYICDQTVKSIISSFLIFAVRLWKVFMFKKKNTICPSCFFSLFLNHRWKRDIILFCKIITREKAYISISIWRKWRYQVSPCDHGYKLPSVDPFVHLCMRVYVWMWMLLFARVEILFEMERCAEKSRKN